MAPQRAGAFGLSESPGQARSRAFASIPVLRGDLRIILLRLKLSSLPPLLGGMRQDPFVILNHDIILICRLTDQPGR